MVNFRKMLDEFREKKRIKVQKEREQLCIDFFANEWKSIEYSKDDFEIPDMPNGIWVMCNNKGSNWLYQAYLFTRSLCSKQLRLKFGDFTKSYKEGEKLYRISDIPEDLWMSTDDFPRPTSPCWILCRYTDDHYEVVNYSKGIWVTELDFPVKPKAFFVLQYLID